jgi:hypothetical protein
MLWNSGAKLRDSGWDEHSPITNQDLQHNLEKSSRENRMFNRINIKMKIKLKNRNNTWSGLMSCEIGFEGMNQSPRKSGNILQLWAFDGLSITFKLLSLWCIIREWMDCRLAPSIAIVATLSSFPFEHESSYSWFEISILFSLRVIKENGRNLRQRTNQSLRMTKKFKKFGGRWSKFQRLVRNREQTRERVELQGESQNQYSIEWFYTEIWSNIRFNKGKDEKFTIMWTSPLNDKSFNWLEEAYRFCALIKTDVHFCKRINIVSIFS